MPQQLYLSKPIRPVFCLTAGLSLILWLLMIRASFAQTETAHQTGTVNISGFLASLGDVHLLTNDKGETIRLFSDNDSELLEGELNRLHGQSVVVNGHWSEPYMRGQSNAAMWVTSVQATPLFQETFDPSAVTADISGDNPWVWILCKFSDDASEPTTLSYFQSLSSSLNPYFQETSYNKASITGSIAVGWYTLPQPRSYYVYDMGAGEDIDFTRAANDCTAAADADVDFSNFYGLNLMFNGELDTAFGVTTVVNMTLDGVSKYWPSVFIDNKGSYNMALTAHEMYHGFGLGHSAVRNPDGSVLSGSSWDPVGVGACGFSSCTPSHIPAPQKDVLGWIDADKIVEATLETQTVTLESLALPQTGNPLMVKIPLENNHYYTLEARRPVGAYDGKVPGATVLIHEVLPTYNNGNIGLIPLPDAVSGLGSIGAMWSEGRVFTNTNFGITVTIVAETATGFEVKIDRTPVSTSILYVDDSATSGVNNGSNWDNAYTDLQTALSAANPTSLNKVEIWVAEGTYKPTSSANRDATFALEENITLYGGFAGTESAITQRDIGAHPTILSGDLLGNDNDNIAAAEATRSENSYHVVTANGVAAVMDGFIITGGNANGSGSDRDRGAGILTTNSTTTYRNVVIQHNSASLYGGGVYNYNGQPQFINALFAENNAQYQGGGLYNIYKNATLINSTVYNNKAAYYSNAEGGGIYAIYSTPQILNSIFWANMDQENGGGTTKAQLSQGTNGVYDVSYSLIAGSAVYTGTGNLNSDPLFINAPADLHLQNNSPAIDAGSNEAIPAGVTIDLDGHGRFVDHPQPDTGLGTAPLVDMGAYETANSEANQSPNTPNAPSPADAAVDVFPNNVMLSWSGGDPDGDVVTYTISFGIVNPPSTVGTNTTASWEVTNLLQETTYYWQITADDGTDTAVGPVWSFTTSSSELPNKIYLPLLLKG